MEIPRFGRDKWIDELEMEMEQCFSLGLLTSCLLLSLE